MSVAKLIWKMVFLKYAQMYSLTQMQIFCIYVYKSKSHHFLMSRHFVYIDDSVSVIQTIRFSVAAISAKNFKHTFSPTLSF